MYTAQPGLVSSPLYSKGDHKKATMLAVEFFQSFYGQSPVRGCRSLLRAATDPNLVGKHLCYYSCMQALHSRNLRQAYRHTLCLERVLAMKEVRCVAIFVLRCFAPVEHW